MSPGALETIETILPGMVVLRHDIHRDPDPSGQEQATANRLLEYLKPACPDYIHRNFGGHGVWQ